MEGQKCVWPFAVLLMMMTSALADDKVTYAKIGGVLSLKPPQASSGPITAILWTYNGNLAAEWIESKVPLKYYGGFNTRTTLKTTNGHLEVKALNKSDAGLYGVEINNQAQAEKYDVKVISEVPTPEVMVGPLTCGPGMEECTLTCYGADTADAEPISYSWKTGDRTLEGSQNNPKQSQTIPIINDAEMRSVRTFTCGMKNPVSEKQSEPKRNPFFQEVSEGPPTALIVCLIILFVVGVGAGVGVWKREMIINRFRGEQTRAPSSSPNGPSSSDPLKTDNV